MFGRGGKIIVFVKPIVPGQNQGPVAASGSNSMKFIFKSGGEDDVFFLIK